MDYEAMAQRLTDYFNGGPAESLRAFCDRPPIINSAIPAASGSSGPSGESSLAALRGGCRAAFPGINFQMEAVTPSPYGFSLSWRARFGPEQYATAAAACTCRIRLDRGKIREVWFGIDLYSVFQQTGRICAAPGQSVSHSESVNRRAVESLVGSLARGASLSEPFTAETVVHGTLKKYRDILHGIEMDTFRFEGPGRIGEFLGFVREHFTGSIEVSIGDGISQGHTTTFRGKTRGRVGTGVHRYDTYFGFRSPGDRIMECWLKIAPPPTLMECLV